MPCRLPSEAADLARLSSALDRAAIRARVAVQRGEWGDAAEAAIEAQAAKEALQAARQPAGSTNVVGRVRVRG